MSKGHIFEEQTSRPEALDGRASKRRTRGSVRLLAAGSALVAISVLVAANTAGAGAAGKACTSKARWTAAEVNKVANFKVSPVYAVPKCHAKYTFAFLNLDDSNPTFHDVGVGLRAAAKFYGVKLLYADLKGNTSNTATTYQQLRPFHPTIVGTVVNPQDGVLFNLVRADGGNELLFGGSYANPPTHTYQLKSSKDVYVAAGQMIGRKLGQEAKKRQASTWKGKDVILIEAGQSNFPTVVNREDGIEKGFRQFVKPKEVIKFDTNGDTATTQQKTTAVIQSHPGAVFVVGPLNDEVGLGGVQAINLSSNPRNGIVAGIGGDEVGRNAVRNDKNHVFLGTAFVAVQPRAWNWVEGAIAIMQHHRFVLPPFGSELTWVDKTNIAKLFPKGKYPNG
jgi:ABC-type sugar transport system substrate-binding protein